MSFILIGIGGFLGANARYFLGGLLTRLFPGSFPFETMIINISGSFVLSFFMTIALGRLLVPVEYRILFATGFLGSYTTFSTLTYETLSLFEGGDTLYAVLNIVGSITFGLIAGYLGIVLGRLI